MNTEENKRLERIVAVLVPHIEDLREAADRIEMDLGKYSFAATVRELRKAADELEEALS